MSKSYICSTSRIDRTTRVIEVPTAQIARDMFKEIKSAHPKVSLGVYGAKDFATLKRTQRNLKEVQLVTRISELI